MDNKPLRLACYARYSTSMQREESISAQLRAMKKFCADNGWKIVGKYVDAFTTDRIQTNKRSTAEKYAELRRFR